MLPVQQRLARVKSHEEMTVARAKERSFLLFVIVSDGVSETEAGHAQGDYRNQSFNRQHTQRPPFMWIPFRVSM